MEFLLYSKGTATTGKALAACLGIESGLEAPNSVLDLLIRWGSTASIPYKPKSILNKAAAIAQATDKIESLKILTANEVQVPEIITLETAREKKGLIKVPSLGRLQTHTQGRDIVLCMQAKDVNRCIKRGLSDYFVVYIPTKREYRIHVFKGQIIRINQKLLQNGGTWVPFLRNFENGYVFGQPKRPLTADQGQMCIKAVQSLGLDFGAVDLILSDDDKSYVLEVNTGPALVENGLDIYTEAIKKVINATQPAITG